MTVLSAGFGVIFFAMLDSESLGRGMRSLKSPDWTAMIAPSSLRFLASSSSSASVILVGSLPAYRC